MQAKEKSPCEAIGRGKPWTLGIGDSHRIGSIPRDFQEFPALPSCWHLEPLTEPFSIPLAFSPPEPLSQASEAQWTLAPTSWLASKRGKVARAMAWEMHTFPCWPWCEVAGPTVHLSHVVSVTDFCGVAPGPDYTIKCVK